MSSQHPQITRTGVQHIGASVPVDDLLLREGAEVVLRVVSAPQNGGRGLISLAGRQLQAQLPPGLAAGQRLTAAVEAQGAERVLLRIVRGAPDEPTDATASQLAARLAVTGDAELVRVALALAGPAVPLPGGGAASVEVDPDDCATSGGPALGRARVTLHSPELGPIEITLTLAPSGIGATVEVEPGRATAAATAALPDLTEALERSSGRAATVGLHTRGPDLRRPAPPVPLEWVDVRA